MKRNDTMKSLKASILIIMMLFPFPAWAGTYHLDIDSKTITANKRNRKDSAVTARKTKKRKKIKQKKKMAAAAVAQNKSENMT